MKLFTFGDSWTEGVGGNQDEENTTDILEEKTKIRQKYCWPKHLSALLNVEIENYGVGATSNCIIFNSISTLLSNKKINKDDFVVVMWTSSLREQHPFFPVEDEFHFWGKRYTNKKYLYDRIFSYIKGENEKYDNLKKEYKEFYISNLMNDTYYDIVNQNYIIYLQYMFTELGIRFLFVDAFDTMISQNIVNEVNKTSFIKKEHYWNFSTKTCRDLLIETDRADVWQDNKKFINTAGKHPSNNGYKMIAQHLYDWIIKENLLYYSTKTPESKFI
jgi:lysophospholipase L1-like esterase